MCKQHYIAFFITLISVCGFSQNQTDLYTSVDNYVRNTSPNIALNYVDDLLNKAQDSSIINTLNTAKLFPMMQAEMYDLILKNTQHLLADNRLDTKLKLIVHIRRALVFEILENFDQSLKELQIAEAIINNTSSLKNSKFEAEVLYRYASLYRIQDKLKLAENYIDKSIALSTKYNHYNALAVAYMVKGFLQPAEAFTNKISYSKQALKNFKSHKDSLGISAMYYSLGLINQRLGNNKVALAYTDSVILAAKNYQYVFSYNHAFKLRSDIFKKQKRLDSALVNFEKFNELSKKEVTEKQKLKVKQLEYDFLVEKEKINKTQIENENKNISNYNKKLKFLIASLLFFIAILLFLAYTIYLRNRSIKQQKIKIVSVNKILNTNVKEKELLLKELNHRVKNNLSLILSLVNFQSKEIDNEFYKAKFNTLKHRIEAISIVHNQIMYSGKTSALDNVHDISDYITKIAQSLIGLDTRGISFKTNVPKIYITLDSALPIGILINELVSNSIKHAETKGKNLEINVDVIDQKDFIILKYKDNGTQFNTNQNKYTLGLTIIKSMVKQLKGNYSREQSNFTINIPKNTKSDV